MTNDPLAKAFGIPPVIAQHTGQWLSVARNMAVAGRLAEAMMAVERALTLDPHSLPAKSLHKSLTRRIEAAEPTLMKLELAAALCFDQAPPQLELAFAYAARDRLHDAERQFRRTLALEPDLAEAHGGLAALYLRADLPDKARESALVAVQLEPAQALACQTLSTLAEREGDTQKAEVWLDRAYETCALFHEIVPDSPCDILVLATRSQGNIPYRCLLPSTRFSRYVWYMEHARADQILPKYDVVFNSIGDPDLTGPSAGPVARFLSQNKRPLINRPERVQATFRHLIPELLGDIDGVYVPKTVRIVAADIAQSGFDLPILVRPLASHGGLGLYRANAGDDLNEIAARLAGREVYVTEYVDYHQADNQYRKGRMMFIGHVPLPYHWAISTHWMVHYDSSDMVDGDWRREEEERYLYDTSAFLGATAMNAITEIGRRIDLDYCGLDFSLLPDGRVLVFEANATMLVHTEDEDSQFNYRNPAVTRITDAFRTLLMKRAAL